MGVVGAFLMVLGAIMAFAARPSSPGINVNTLGFILLLSGVVLVLYSLLFWSRFTPWGRRSRVVRRTVVDERVEEPPVDPPL